MVRGKEIRFFVSEARDCLDDLKTHVITDYPHFHVLEMCLSGILRQSDWMDLKKLEKNPSRERSSLSMRERVAEEGGHACDGENSKKVVVEGSDHAEGWEEDYLANAASGVTYGFGIESVGKTQVKCDKCFNVFYVDNMAMAKCSCGSYQVNKAQY